MTEGERLTNKLWNDQPYNTNLSVIREILFALLKDKVERDLSLPQATVTITDNPHAETIVGGVVMKSPDVQNTKDLK